MDIKEDLKKIGVDRDVGINVIRQAENQQYELSQKIHILKAVYFAEVVEKLANTDFFAKDDIKYLQLKCKYSEDMEIDILEFYLLENHGEKVGGIYDEDCHEQSKILYSDFGIFFEFNSDFINDKIKKDFVSLELMPGIKEGILSLLLNEELKKIYDYNQMNLELTNNVDNSNKKMKM